MRIRLLRTRAVVVDQNAIPPLANLVEIITALRVLTAGTRIVDELRRGEDTQESARVLAWFGHGC